MSAHQFDAALAKHDGDALFRQIYELTVRNEQCSGSTLPTTAADYLRAFCDDSSPTIRRRWIGVALRRMIRTSTDVVGHLVTRRHDLTQLGQVIQGGTELEETRILAGAIIREAMEQGIKFSQFWPSDKVPATAANFPKESGRWMNEFQTFLDTLAIMTMTTDPAILFPVSLITSDGFKWHSEGDGIVAILQSGVFTFIIPDVSTQDLTFVDIPLHHIQSVHTRKSTLHDSQAQGTEHEPWDLIMCLRPSSWTYRVNASEHKGNEFTILFVNAKDAEECRVCIMESVNLESKGSRMSVSQALFLGPGEAWSDQVSSKAKDNVHSEERPLITAPANLDDARGSSAVENGLQSGNDAGATIPSGPATTIPVKAEPLRLIEASSTPSSTEDQSSDPDTKRGPEPPPTVEQPTKSPQEAGARKLPKINRLVRKSNNAVDPSIEGGDQQNDFDFPGELQRMTRSSPILKKGASSGTTRPKIATPSASIKKAMKVKQSKPKPKSKHVSRTQVDGTEDEEDPLSSQPVVHPLGRSRTNGNSAARTRVSPTQSLDPDQEQEKSKRDPRLSGLPKISNAVEKTASANKTRPESDVWVIPQENESRSTRNSHISKMAAKPTSTKKTRPRSATSTVPQNMEDVNGEPSRKISLDKKSKDNAPPTGEPKGSLRTRRAAVKEVNYKDAESSASEEYESDYIDAQTKKPRFVATAAMQQKGTVSIKAAVAKVSEVKPKPRRNKATTSKADMPPISPEKHSVLSSLLNKPKSTSTHEAKARPGKASFGKNPSGRHQEIMTPPEPENPAPAPFPDPDDQIVTVPEIEGGLPGILSKQNTSVFEANVRTILPPNLTEPVLESDSLLREFVDYDGGIHEAPIPLINGAKTSVPGCGADALRKSSEIHVGAIGHVSAKSTDVITSKRKRTTEGTPPATPRKKRTKTELAGKANADQAEAAVLKPLTTMSRPRVLSDPSSPLGNQRRVSLRPSIQETVQNLRYLHHEHNSSPTLPAVPLVQESHIIGSIKRPQRRHTPLNQHAQRIHSTGSANAEILSSNSKPIPASPHAESVAISGHADNDHVDLEKKLGDAETARSDPFANRRVQTPKSTAFIRRLTEESAGVDEPQVLEPEICSDRSPERPIIAVDLESPVNNLRDSAQRVQHAPKALSGLSNSIRVRAPSLVKAAKQPMQAPEGLMQEAQSELLSRRAIVYQDSVVDALPQAIESIQPQEQAYNHADRDVDMEGDETLVALAETPASYKATPLHFQSSPPGDFTPSSHSSTSADLAPGSGGHIPTDEAEEMEWEASLQPHQRSVHDQLMRISKHVVRHVVHKETAVDDIAEMYAKDGEHLLNRLVERHSGEFESMLKGVEKRKDTMRDEYEGLAKRLMRERAKYGPKESE
jgi:hypothetical protein